MKQQQNKLSRQVHRFPLDPYGDNYCFDHSVNFNIVAKVLDRSLKADTEQRILDSGYIQYITDNAANLGIHLRVDTDKSLRDQLLMILHQITIADGPLAQSEKALLQQVHWGVWQKLSGLAVRRIANETMNQQPQLISQNLYREYVLALSEKVLQTRYPQAGFYVSADRFPVLMNAPATVALVAEYCQAMAEHFPLDPNDDKQRQVAIFALTAASTGDESQLPATLKQAFHHAWQQHLLPMWLHHHADNQHLTHDMVGEEHQLALSDRWHVNILQVSNNPRHAHASLRTVNFADFDDSRDDIIVQRKGAHYIASIEVVSPLSKALVQAATRDKAIYATEAGQVNSRLGTWLPEGDFIPPADPVKTIEQRYAETVALTKPKDVVVDVKPVLDIAQVQQTLAIRVASAKQDKHQVAAQHRNPDVVPPIQLPDNSVVKLQLELDEALAWHIAEHQDEADFEHDDKSLEDSFYQRLAIAKPETNYGKLYQRLGLLSAPRNTLNSVAAAPAKPCHQQAQQSTLPAVGEQYSRPTYVK